MPKFDCAPLTLVARGGPGVVFATLTHMKVIFIIEQPFLHNEDIVHCEKVIEL